MRILHICSGNLYGGVETIQVTLARYRNECPQMEPHFSVCFEGRLSRELRELEVPVHNLGVVRVRNPFSIWSARAQLRELLSHSHYDAAVCHSAWSQAIFGPVVRSTGVPLLFWLHGAPSGQHWLERWAKRTPPEKIICCSRFTRNLIANVYAGVPSAVVYAPVSPIVKPTSEAQRFAIRSELSTPADAVVVIQVSRMEAWKGHELHLEALSKIRHIPGWMCWFVGGAQHPEEERYLQELKWKAERYGIAHRLRFLGQRTDIPRLLTASDLFCQPNVGPEPFGIVFVEALSAGLPVITTAMGGPLEIIRWNCGVLIPPNNASALAVSLKRLTVNHEVRMRMSDSAPLRALEMCNPSIQVKRLFGVIKRTVAWRYVA